ncbi:uncharacterized protein LOC144583715 [Pogona vitticeps]
MERMEVEPIPAASVAAGGGGALRRSNSAPLLPGATGSPPLDQGPAGPQRTRRCSVCLESRGLGGEATMEALPRNSGPPSDKLPSPPSTGAPSCTLESLKRKGGLDVDSPPKKLFVAGVPQTPPAL